MKNIDPVAFYLPFGSHPPVTWYGIFITTAILIGFVVACILAKRRGIVTDFMLELFLWVVPLAVVFARVAYIVFHPSQYPVHSWADFGKLFAINEGGISILGAIPGGALGAYFACKRNKVPYSYVLDVIAPALVLGQALGRWGNWANQELYGREILDPAYQKFPFAVYIDLEGGWFQATFFYEMVLNLIGFAILMAVFYRSNKNLMTFIAYLCWYMVVRSVMEIFRDDAVIVGGVHIGVLGCAIAAGVSMVIAILIYCHKIRTGSPKVLAPPKMQETTGGVTK